MKKRIRNFFIACIIAPLLIIFLHESINLTFVIIEPLNYEFVTDKYQEFDFDKPIESQINKGVYENKTMVALNLIRSSGYDFNFLEKHIDSYIYEDEFYGYEKEVIINELDRIYAEVGRKALIVGYLITIGITIILYVIHSILRELIRWITDKARPKFINKA